MIQAYPLQWPTGWPRSRDVDKKDARFGRGERQVHTHTDGTTSSWMRRGDLTMADAMKRVHTELEKLGVNVREDCVVSTNLTLNLSGLPRADQGEPSDRGVAVYWQKKGQPMKVMAIDRYFRVRDNLAAIAATLEAMRAIERHGGGQILERAFTGFTALPDADGADCFKTLGVKATASEDEILAAFRNKAKQAHPDAGGSNDAWAKLSAAKDLALKSRRGAPA